jgi:DnaK suppressor protein
MSDDPGQRDGELRNTLLKLREKVLRDTEEELSKYIKGEDRQLVESVLDSGDYSVIDLSEDIKLRTLNSFRDTLIKLDESLRKLDEGSYGVCDDCGDEINPERLKILPFAIRCRDCQEDAEEKEASDRSTSL